MSNYVKATNFATKDTLPTGDSNKIVKGTEIDNEFNALAGAISSKADLASPALTGTPTAPTATTGSNTTQLANTAFVSTAVAAAFPSGGIIMWAGLISAIPSGWYLCNGSNSTPDLRDKFIVGASADSGGAAKTNITGSYTQTGGTKDAIVVSHSHTASSSSSVSDPGHFHYSGGNGAPNGGGAGSALTNTGNSPNNTLSATTGISVSTSTTVNSNGSDGTNQNLPPYYALAFIMKA